jgi:tol-pal system protein YbgF
MRFNKGFAVVAASGFLLFSSHAGSGQDAAPRPPAAPFEVAQIYTSPPADIGAPRGGQDDASLLLRVERLESQLRQMNGLIEQMQNDNHRLADQLRKFQQDVEFRFQENGGRNAKPQKRGDLDTPPPAQPTIIGSDQGLQTSTPSTVPHTNRRSDAFDPTLDPDAPGAPRSLGNGPAVTATERPLGDERDPSAPLDLSSSPSKSTRPIAPDAPNTAQLAVPTTTPTTTLYANASPSAVPANPVKEEFDAALGLLKQKQYEVAEKSFAAFLQKNPKTRYSAEATYYLGETYYQRGRQREAAEQYLKISTDFATSSRAPEALVRLGQSLHAIGAKEQACASFSEVGRRYPNAPAAVKAAAEREAKRVQC